MLTYLFIAKAFVRVWLACTFLYRKNSDKYELSRFFSPTWREEHYLQKCPERYRKFSVFLGECRDKVGHYWGWRQKALR